MPLSFAGSTKANPTLTNVNTYTNKHFKICKYAAFMRQKT